jgi:hypothetical protein
LAVSQESLTRLLFGIPPQKKAPWRVVFSRRAEINQGFLDHLVKKTVCPSVLPGASGLMTNIIPNEPLPSFYVKHLIIAGDTGWNSLEV